MNNNKHWHYGHAFISTKLSMFCPLKKVMSSSLCPNCGIAKDTINCSYISWVIMLGGIWLITIKIYCFKTKDVRDNFLFMDFKMIMNFINRYIWSRSNKMVVVFPVRLKLKVANIFTNNFYIQYIVPSLLERSSWEDLTWHDIKELF